MDAAGTGSIVNAGTWDQKCCLTEFWNEVVP